MDEKYTQKTKIMMAEITTIFFSVFIENNFDKIINTIGYTM